MRKREREGEKGGLFHLLSGVFSRSLDKPIISTMKEVIGEERHVRGSNDSDLNIK